jgi:hypothetical protein
MQQPKTNRRPENQAGPDFEKLGKLFLECLEWLAAEEQEHLKKANGGKENSKSERRTAKDVKQSAFRSLRIIQATIQEAKKYGYSPAHFYGLPWPLLVLYFELGDLIQGQPSPLLNKGKSQIKGTAARNTIEAHGKELAIWAFRKLGKSNEAAIEIAKIFQRHRKRANGKKEFNADPIINWEKQARKPDGTGPDTGTTLAQREILGKQIQELDRVANFKLRQTSIDTYSAYGEVLIIGEEHLLKYTYSDEDKATLVLDELRKFIAGTSFEP